MPIGSTQGRSRFIEPLAAKESHEAFKLRRKATFCLKLRTRKHWGAGVLAALNGQAPAPAEGWTQGAVQEYEAGWLTGAELVPELHE